MNKANLIEKIIQQEWVQFTSTKNIGHRAVCQDQKGNFLASRKSYWQMYPEDVLNSYLNDLAEAKKNHINLITQKYGYMMENTDKENYEKIKARLLPVSPQKKDLLSSIMLIYMAWEKEIEAKNPSLDNKNRVLYSSNDTKYSTSVETYMRGELSTYSIETLSLILKYFLEEVQKKNNVIYSYMNSLNTYKENKDIPYCANTCPQKNSSTIPSQQISVASSVSNMNLQKAELLVNFAENTAFSMNLPVVITVVDMYSNIILLKRMDNSLVASLDISPAKAKTAASFKMDTQSLSHSFLSKTLNNFEASNTKYCFLGGGIPIFLNGSLLGAIGVSGGTVEEDIKIAKSAIDAFYKAIQ